MKLTTFLAFLAALAANPAWALLQPRTLLFWDPPNAYQHQRLWKASWEDKCDKALTRAECDGGTIHGGVRKAIKPGGEKTYYVNVEAAPSMQPGMEKGKRMRVFEDTSTEDGWLEKDHLSMTLAKRPKKRNRQAMEGLQPVDSEKALLSWNPVDAYRNQPRRRLFWEQTCGQVLVKEGCVAGRIHQSESRMIRPNRMKTSYVRVEGTPSAGEEYEKKMRVFLDGSYEGGWSERDRYLMGEARRPRKLPKLAEDHGVLISWDPANTYEKHRRRKAYWEHRCRQALAEKGCIVGKIHKGESKVIKPNGDKAAYVRVEGSSSLGMEPRKNMRVFQDGSVEDADGWSERDLYLMAEIKRPHLKDPGPKLAEDQRVLLSWDPTDSYNSRKRKRKYWEMKCNHALAEKGCAVGRIHEGETRVVKPGGEETAYVRVEGGPSNGLEYGKEMRVFKDGSFENGWSGRDHHLLAQAKQRGRRRIDNPKAAGDHQVKE